ncbi:hypothetical protein PENFLA_c014G00097 [Penicillium flavigenum]|uniref:ASST-domain-containing protein n=1 Tax=Penicillium flavigenum TaxID=254877 RepID=A0A1V6T4V3_9EURO|nr:hypothetical protein PENFLA_c014G00097 [Penicillium flavigenum]
MLLQWLVWLNFLNLASADWQFLTRPELSPPKLNITVPASQTAAGYIFISPKEQLGYVGPEQPAPYIYREDGELIWSGVGYYNGYVVDFGVVHVNGTPVLRAFQGTRVNGLPTFGYHTILDNHYQTVNVVHAASHKIALVHEFQVVDGGSALIEVGPPILKDLSAFGGDEEQKWITSAGFQEIDLATGELLFEWYMLDHISPGFSYLRLDPDLPTLARSPSDAWTGAWINSIDKDDEGNYLVSFRFLSAIYKINGTSGEIMWQLGGKNGSDFEIPPNLEFRFQHDARMRYRSPDGSIEHISLFDNANADMQPDHYSGLPSKVRCIELNHKTKSISEIWTFTAPDNLIAASQGNVQTLPNGNVFANWGVAGAVTEFSSEGAVLFHAYLDSEPNTLVHSYRGFRSNWTGLSSEEPAILALRNQEGVVSVWVSWNGDTETRDWAFHLEDQSGLNVNSLGSQTRDGFETRFEIRMSGSLKELQEYSVVAEALDSSGASIGRTRPTQIQDDTLYRAQINKLSSQKVQKADYQQSRMEL